MNEEAVRDTLTQAGIPCEIVDIWCDQFDGTVQLTGTPFHVQVGRNYLIVVKEKTQPFTHIECAEFTKISDLVEQVHTVLKKYRSTN